ncbi:MAG: tRNA (adenosine(37)-N6)-threonylcarbamoyltransferase complex dimerization subunit type 1 TsaB [Nitrospira sp. WS238]|nr:tRNA (adenosine(37)-N6)-threonylcarbamoyltransferase complex dimerization subunit type 1 TsaB [Nitrospira sp. WS238]
MRILAVETATAWQSVAVLEDDRALALHDQEADGAHGSLLLPTIDRLLKNLKVSLGELDALCCSAGPGSFTGIRVGLATCLGLRAASGLPLVLVPTLEAMARTVHGESRPICPVLVSRRGEVYWAIFRCVGENQWERIVSEQVGSPNALGQQVPDQTLMVGSGWSLMEAEIRAALPESVTVSVGPDHACRPSAIHVGRLGMERLRRGEVAGEAVAPMYVQRAEAEIQYERSGGLSPVARRRSRVEQKVAARLARGRQPRSSRNR